MIASICCHLLVQYHIINLGQIYYRPPQKFEEHMLDVYLGVHGHFPGTLRYFLKRHFFYWRVNKRI